MNYLMLLSALIALVTTGIHIIAGQLDPVRPLLSSEINPVSKRTLLGVWHVVSIDLALSTIALFYLALANPLDSQDFLAWFIAVHYIAYAILFLFLTLSMNWPNRLFKLPQWTLLAPVGILTLVATL